MERQRLDDVLQENKRLKELEQSRRKAIEEAEKSRKQVRITDAHQIIIRIILKNIDLVRPITCQ